MMIYSNKHEHMNSWPDSKRTDKVRKKLRTKWQTHEHKPHQNHVGGSEKRRLHFRHQKGRSSFCTSGNRWGHQKLRASLQSARGHVERITRILSGPTMRHRARGWFQNPSNGGFDFYNRKESIGALRADTEPEEQTSEEERKKVARKFSRNVTTVREGKQVI